MHSCTSRTKFHFLFTLIYIIIHQTHYEKSDWSRAFNQFTIACELDMINVLSAADNAFIMSSSTSFSFPKPFSHLLAGGALARESKGSGDIQFSSPRF